MGGDPELYKRSHGIGGEEREGDWLGWLVLATIVIVLCCLCGCSSTCRKCVPRELKAGDLQSL